jgi:hypothetical protein
MSKWQAATAKRRAWATAFLSMFFACIVYGIGLWSRRPSIVEATVATAMKCSSPSHYTHQDQHLHRKLHVALNTYKNNDFLIKALRLYAACPVVHTVHVIWSEQGVAPPNWLHRVPRTIVEVRTDSSLLERFRPLNGVDDGDPVYSVDDDIRIPCSSLAVALHQWYSHRTSMTGFFARKAVYRHRFTGEMPTARYSPLDSYLQTGLVDFYRVPALREFNWVSFMRRNATVALAGTPYSGLRFGIPCPGASNDSKLRGSGFNIVLTKAAIFDSAYLRKFWQEVPEDMLNTIKKARNGEDLAFSWMLARFATHPLVWVSHAGTHQDEYDDGDVSWLMQFKYGKRISQTHGHRLKRSRVMNMAHSELAQGRLLPLSDEEVTISRECFLAGKSLQLAWEAELGPFQ